ncbi:HlyD family secretion protein [Oceanicaulis sp. HTCC2633]|uniref:HlyD family secretion protein n=1 Tax=Oceanicaulis sp. HTCC2633 TaxID=314254 RepID=UPI000066D3B4|nr:HlyD family efflux transporter periplasmic adaptor subunit [Oceanicaulis sp. HTCC2633]EAP90989.1 HlyD family secretion protein [Oceanicaulis sp. HTCC2633]
MSNLFHKEAMEHATQRLDGEVVLALPLPLKLLIAIASLTIASVVIFASTASYSRKEMVQGWLTPDQGVIRALALQGGQIEALLVQEGDIVSAGAPLARLRLDTDTLDGASGARVMSALQAQTDAAERSANAEIARMEQDEARLTGALHGFMTERAGLSRQISLQRERITLADEQIERAVILSERGYMSGRELDDRRLMALAARQELAALERNDATISRQILEVRAALQSLPLQIEAERARAASVRAALDERITTQSARNEGVITAPADVRVAALPVRQGQTLAPGETVAVLMPEDGELVAELYLPTRAAGFIHVGQDVRLMYQAYPHQRFGSGKATITAISRTVLAPNEAAIPGLNLQEPVFRVEAMLERAEVDAYGETIPLQPGLLLNADIILDRRSLIEWLFDPLFAAGRRG